MNTSVDTSVDIVENSSDNIDGYISNTKMKKISIVNAIVNTLLNFEA